MLRAGGVVQWQYLRLAAWDPGFRLSVGEGGGRGVWCALGGCPLFALLLEASCQMVLGLSAKVSKEWGLQLWRWNGGERYSIVPSTACVSPRFAPQNWELGVSGESEPGHILPCTLMLKTKWETTCGMTSYRILIYCQMELLRSIFKSLRKWSLWTSSKWRNIHPRTSMKIQ